MSGTSVTETRAYNVQTPFLRLVVDLSHNLLYNVLYNKSTKKIASNGICA